MFDFFVWGNMSGASVYHGQSAWTREDFAARRQILRADANVHVDPWVPLGPGSFRWTSEGVPSAPVTYIQQGSLVSPVLDLKYARRLGLPPLTPPGGSHSVRITLDSEIGVEALTATMPDGILVLSVLGLHTQDRTSGNYSLSAPQALLIREGEVQGKVRATLSGNFFENLRDEALRLVRFAGQHNAGFAYPGRVTLAEI